MKSYKFIVEKTNTGFSAYAENYPIFTNGKSIPELINSTYEATEFYFEEENVKVEPNDIKFEIDFKQFFPLKVFKNCICFRTTHIFIFCSIE